MKEATGEVSMTVVTLVAIAVIGGIIAANWGNISTRISNLWNSGGNNACDGITCTTGTLNPNTCTCQ